MSKVALTWTKEISKSGAFVRSDSVFRNNIVSSKSQKKEHTDSNVKDYPAEKDRYAFYHSYACPWSTRVLMAIKLKGLEDVIGPISVVQTFLDQRSWRFNLTANASQQPEDAYEDYQYCEGATQDFVNGKSVMREVYALSSEDGSWTGKVTVPVIFDKQTNKIVNNESSQIIRFLNSEFNEFAKYPDIDIYPEDLREKIDEINEWVYHKINNGVYKCGFATSQEAYNESYYSLFEALDRVEEILKENRYLCGSRFTEADIRLFTTLIRFDPVYYNHFRCNKKRLKDYHNLWNYMLEIAQMPWVKDTINLEHIKNHYFTSHRTINPLGIVPLGPDYDLTEKHDRDQLKSDSPWVNHE